MNNELIIKTKILTIEELKNAGIEFNLYSNGNYKCKDKTGWHLIRNGIDLLEGKNATWCHLYSNGGYEFEDEAGLHLIRDGLDLLEGKNATWCYLHPNGDCEFRDKAGLHLIEKINN